MDYTTKELAELANVDRSRIRQLIALGDKGPFPGAYQPAWEWRIPKEEGDAWLEKRKQK